MAHRTVLGGLAAASMLWMGCGDGGMPVDAGARQAPSSLRTYTFPTAPQMKSYDAELEGLVGEIHGFGGMFVEGGRLHVYIKDGRPLDAREVSVLENFLLEQITPGSRPENGVSDVAVISSTYDYRELREMYLLAIDLTATLPVTITDIDERYNRILIGAMNEETVESAFALLRRSGIPDDAVRVEVVPPTNVQADLQDHVRPTLPGTRISAPGGCTLSFNGYRAVGSFSMGWSLNYSQAYFVTNSHCTSTFVGYDGGNAGQPSLVNPIGVEIADPAPFTNSQNTECPIGRACRWSDAALFQYDSGVSISYPSVPNVSGLSIVGSRAITYYGMPWFIWGPMAVRKIGSTSGESSGALTTTCARIPVYNGTTYAGVDMLCQYQATFTATGGDSGSPVLNPASESDTILYGVLWGIQAAPYTGTLYSTFSPLGSMQVELHAASGVHIVPCDACVGWIE